MCPNSWNVDCSNSKAPVSDTRTHTHTPSSLHVLRVVLPRSAPRANILEMGSSSFNGGARFTPFSVRSSIQLTVRIEPNRSRVVVTLVVMRSGRTHTIVYLKPSAGGFRDCLIVVKGSVPAVSQQSALALAFRAVKQEVTLTDLSRVSRYFMGIV